MTDSVVGGIEVCVLCESASAVCVLADARDMPRTDILYQAGGQYHRHVSHSSNLHVYQIPTNPRLWVLRGLPSVQPERQRDRQTTRVPVDQSVTQECVCLGELVCNMPPYLLRRCPIATDAGASTGGSARD